jgi:micrococcal nuclease
VQVRSALGQVFEQKRSKGTTSDPPVRLEPVRRAPRLLSALLLAGCGTAAPADPARPGLPVPAEAQEATVVRVVDGDTVVLRGRGVGPLPGSPTKVRILLVDTPEVHTQQECFGSEADTRATELMPRGEQVRVQADRDPQDRFGRALLHVWNAQGVNVGEALVREGFAEVLQLDPNERYLEAFAAAEEQARSAGRGLWSACR